MKDRQDRVKIKDGTRKKTNANESVQASAFVLNYQRHVFTPELQLTGRRPPKLQNLPQSQKFSGSNPSQQVLAATS